MNVLGRACVETLWLAGLLIYVLDSGIRWIRLYPDCDAVELLGCAWSACGARCCHLFLAPLHCHGALPFLQPPATSELVACCCVERRLALPRAARDIIERLRLRRGYREWYTGKIGSRQGSEARLGCQFTQLVQVTCLPGFPFL